MSAGEDRVTRTDIRSPVRGTIKQINLNTIGGVVRPGESILEIVPLDDTLLIEARIRPADIAFLHPGQKAMIKITAYDFSIFGGLDGVLESISADTIEDDDGESFYKVKLRTQKNAIAYRGEELPIMPGMTASIDILTGKKSVLAYLLKPILRAKQNALRER
jgi:adhesin transport system membrane fusion protein